MTPGTGLIAGENTRFSRGDVVSPHPLPRRSSPGRQGLRTGLFLLAALLAIPADAGPVTALAFSPDGSAWVCNGARSVEVRSTTDSALQHRWDIPLPKISTLRFDPQGRFLAVGGGTPGESGEIHLLAWPGGKRVAHRTLPSDLALSLDFSPDGRHLVAAGANHRAYVWNLSMPAEGPADPLSEPPLTLDGHAGPVLAVAWDPAGAFITTASADRSIKVWSPEDGHRIRTFTQHAEPPNVLAFRPNGPASKTQGPSTCASGGDDRTVRIWQPGLGRMVRIIRKHEGAILGLAWMPEGATLFSAGSEGILRRLDADSDEVLAEWAGHDDWILALAVSPDGTVLASGDASGGIKLWDPRPMTPKLLHSVRVTKEKPAVYFRRPPGP